MNANTLVRRCLTALTACVAIGVAAFGDMSRPAAAHDPPTAKAPPTPGLKEKKDALGDPLPAGALLRIGTSRYRDSGSTDQAILTPDGKSVVTTSEAGIVLIDLASGKRTNWITDLDLPSGSEPNISRLVFAPDGKTFFCVHWSRQGRVRPTQSIAVHDVATGKRLAVFKPPPLMPLQAGGPVRFPEFGYDRVWFPAGAKHLVAADHDNTTYLIDPTTGNVVRSFGFKTHAAVSTPDGPRLFTIVQDPSRLPTTVAVHDESGKLVRTLEQTDLPGLIGFDPSGAVLAADGRKIGTGAESIRVWELASGKVLGNITVPKIWDRARQVDSLAVTPDKKSVIAGTENGEIYRFDIATGRELPAPRGHTESVHSLLFADGGKTLVTAGWSRAILRFDLATGKPLADAGGYVGTLHVDRSPDGKFIAAADATGRVELLDGRTGLRLNLLQASGKPVATRVAFAPDGALLATGHQDGRIRLWESATGKLAREVEIGKLKKYQSAGFCDLVFTADGKSLASSFHFGLCLNDVATGKPIWEDPSGTGRIVFLPGERYLVTGGWDDKLTTRDIRTGKAESVAPTTGQHVVGIAVSPDGKLLATCHTHGLVCLRDPATGSILKQWKAHEPMDGMWDLSFGPGAIWLATAGDLTVRVWDSLTGTEIRKFEAHSSAVRGMKFSIDGRTLLSSSHDLTGYVWDVKPKLGPGDARTTEQLWDDLKGKPEAAFRAVWLAAADPAAPEFFGKKLPSPPKLDAEQFKKLVEGLSSGEFREREAAEKALTAFGPAAIGLAKKARADSDSQEVRTRLDRVMKGWTASVFDPEVWRRKRAVVAMELAGTEEARKLLARLAADAPGTMLSDDAAGALKRVEGRGK